MKRILLAASVALLCSFNTFGQDMSPNWYILESGSSAGVVKPGANDMMYYLVGHPGKPMDRTAFQAINDEVNYVAGSAVLVYAKVDDTYLATDVEGRTLLIKGNITAAEHSAASSLGYVKESIESNGVTIKSGAYVWIKKQDVTKNTAVIQYKNKKSLEIPLDKIYVLNETTAKLAPTVKFKEVE